jgi:type IV pilus assembly protein PilB
MAHQVTVTPVRVVYQRAGGNDLHEKLVFEQLVAAKRITVDEIEPLMVEAKSKTMPLIDYLLFRGLLSEAELLRVRAHFWNLEAVTAEELPVDEQLAKLLKPEQARGWQALPYGRSREGKLLVAVADGSPDHLTDIRQGLRRENVEFQLAAEGPLRVQVEKAHATVTNLTDDVAELRTRQLRPATLSGADQDAPSVRYLTALITQAVDEGASDIHIEPDELQTRVRLRVDGVLTDLQALPAGEATARVVRLVKMLAEMSIDPNQPSDGSFEKDVFDRTVKLRVVTLPTPYGEAATLRVLDPARSLRDLTTLGMSDRNRKRYEATTKTKTGLALITGPTGSGKSTTLYSTLLGVVTSEIKVMSIEDPIELRLPGVVQIEVQRRGDPAQRWGFTEALKYIVRSDPDVIMVGEIRDLATAQLAVEAAMTGHYVFSTLHTNDALSAVTRLHDLGVENFLIGQAVKVIVAQRLVRKLCEHCRTPVADSRAALAAAGCTDALFTDDMTIYEPHPGGCNKCRARGYAGQTAIHEVLVISKDMGRAIEQGALPSELEKIAIDEGMHRLREDGFEKVIAGITSIAELNRVASD